MTWNELSRNVCCHYVNTMSVVSLISTSRALCATLYKNNNIAREHGRNNIARQARGNTNSRFHNFLHHVDFYRILVQSIYAQNDSKCFMCCLLVAAQIFISAATWVSVLKIDYSD